MDLDDLEHNTRDGLHLASLAGTWIALVPGLAGLRGSVAFAPRLPTGITRLTITICCMHNSPLKVDITSPTTTYRVLDGMPLSLRHHEQPFTVSPGSPVSVPSPAPPTSPPPSQPRHRAPQPHRGAR